MERVTDGETAVETDIVPDTLVDAEAERDADGDDDRDGDTDELDNGDGEWDGSALRKSVPDRDALSE